MTQRDPPPDPELTSLLQARNDGNPEILMELYDRYGHLAFSLALRILGNSIRAEHALERAFLQLWRQPLPDVLPGTSSRQWLLELVYREAIEMLCDQGSTRSRQGAATSVAAPTASDSKPTDRASLPDESSDEIRVLELAYFEGLTYAAIAERLGLDRKTVLRLINDGLRRRAFQMSEKWQAQPVRDVVHPENRVPNNRGAKPTNARPSDDGAYSGSGLPAATEDDRDE